MVHTDGRNKKKPVIERTFYQCRIYRVRGTGFCGQHRINADDLEELVLADIQTHAKKVIKNREKFMRKVLGQMGMFSKSFDIPGCNFFAVSNSLLSIIDRVFAVFIIRKMA